MKKKHRRFNLPKFRRLYYLYIATTVLVLYLVIAYNYFYYVQRRADIAWPNNQHVYNFDNKPDSKNLYVSLGDSLTYGFGADSYQNGYNYQVANSFAEKTPGLSLKDYSYPGSRTDDVIKQLDFVILDNPKIITVFIGVNDAHQLIESSNFKENYGYILYRLTRETNAKIYLINLPSLGANNVQLPPYNIFYDSRTRSHNQTIQELAQEYNLKVIDLYSPTVDLFKKSGPHYSKDLFHPSNAGYKLWADIIKNGIDR